MKIDDVRSHRLFDAADQSRLFRWGPTASSTASLFVISYRTDPEVLASRRGAGAARSGRARVVKYELIRMPDSTGFGDYTETGQVIPVR